MAINTGYKVAAIRCRASLSSDFSEVFSKGFDCDFQKIAVENINRTTGGNNCKSYLPGDVWNIGVAEGVTVDSLVKIKYNETFYWLNPTDFANLENGCNNCCLES